MKNNKNNKLDKIVIVGGGTAGWITAASLIRVLPAKEYSICLVESDQIGTVGVGEATIPPIREFHRMLGVSEQEFIRKTQATFKLGIEFDGWSKEGQSYFHPFGEYGRQFDSVAFHQYWLRANSLQDCGKLEEYSLSSIAAKQNKFAPTSRDPKSILSGIGYAYHFDASLYAKFLRGYSENLGITRIEGKVQDVCLNTETGFIESLQLESEQRIEGDLFIDCTGFAGLLIDKALKVGFDDWTDYLPANSAWAVQTSKPSGQTHPYTKSIARSSGWQWRIPLQNRTGNGLVYSNEFISDDEALHQLLNNLETEPTIDPRKLRFTTGKRKQSWHKNCVAIGLSSGFLEPLESTSIHLIQTSVTRLLQLFPGKEFNQSDINEYNQSVNREMEFVRDFIILHYKVNQRPGGLWEYCRSMQIPDSLAHKIELFSNRGRVIDEKYDLFKTASWVAVMHGQGISPKNYDPIANSKPADRLVQVMNEMRQAMANAANALPSHDDFIRDNCVS